MKTTVKIEDAESVASIAVGRVGDEVTLALGIAGNTVTLGMRRAEARKLGQHLVKVTAPAPKPRKLSASEIPTQSGPKGGV